jgi:anti-sigma B factor antagonist
MDKFFTERQDRGYTIVEFTTDSLMNPLELEGIGQSMYRLVDEQKLRKLLVDFSKVKYLSSQAVGIVLTLNKKLGQSADSSLILCGVGPQLLQLLKITRLDKILTIKPTQEEALKNLPQN